MSAAVVIHGGCGPVAEDRRAGRREGVREAGERGWTILQRGGSALDAVEAAVAHLEDLPLFNAGRGSVLNADGTIETDAAIMDGPSQAAGAVACVTGILHPVQLARRVMDKSPHVLLAGPGAVQFARAHGFPILTAAELEVPFRRAELEAARHGTVGAVACDSQGRLAAATSTGGITGKLPGRVGDTPLIGSGTWADARCAVSCTGHGEHIIRAALARLAAFLHHSLSDAERATELALAELGATVGGDAGLIMVDRDGRMAWDHNTPHMPVCAINSQATRVQD